MVKASGLRGRGGAGFPTGMKWTFVPSKEKRGSKPVYLLCNADESEPGTFKDRVLIEKDPHQILEGMMLSSFALDVKHAYIYIRGEMVHGAEILDAAIGEAYAALRYGAESARADSDRGRAVALARLGRAIRALPASSALRAHARLTPDSA